MKLIVTAIVLVMLNKGRITSNIASYPCQKWA